MENRRATNNIERQIRATQKDLDTQRNTQGSKARKAATANSFAASATFGKTSSDDMLLENELSDANLNLIEFLNQKPKDAADLKF